MAGMSELSLDDYYDAEVYDNEGERVGPVGQVFLDDRTNEPSWVTVRTGLFGLKENFVPLVDATLEDGRLNVAFEKKFIHDAPKQDPDAPLTVGDEDRLQEYYGTEDEPEKISAARDRARGEQVPTATGSDEAQPAEGTQAH